MVSITELLRRLATQRGTSDRYWQDKRRRMEDERARKERKRQHDQIMRRSKAAMIRLQQVRSEIVNPRIATISIQEILGFDVQPKRRRKYASL